MRPYDRFDIQTLLVAEVVIHGRNICIRRLADVAHGRRLKASLGEELAGRFNYALAFCI